MVQRTLFSSFLHIFQDSKAAWSSLPTRVDIIGRASPQRPPFEQSHIPRIDLRVASPGQRPPETGHGHIAISQNEAETFTDQQSGYTGHMSCKQAPSPRAGATPQI